MQSYDHFTLTERENLRILLEEGKSYRQIAVVLGRSPSTISREMRRNGKKDGTYNAWWGSSLYLHRRKKCRRRFRIDTDPDLEAYIREKLHAFWSPETIVAKWKQLHPGAKLGHSTIYAALRRKRLVGCSEYGHLLRRGRLRFKNSGTPGMTRFNPVKPDHRIEEWPWEIKGRTCLGHWEGDTVMGARGKGHLFTCVDRRSRYVCLGLLPGQRTKEETAEVVCQTLAGQKVHSITLDNGTEFALHREIARRLNAVIYFADPHSPWQRGSNENINGWLRFFFPKGCDLRYVTQEVLAQVAALLNNRPRKCLGWLSPVDFLAKCCT